MRGNSTKLRIKPLPPFDFNLSSLIFTGGDPQIRSYDGEKYWRVLGTDKKAALVIIRSTGTVDEPRLAVELKSESELSPADVKKTKRKINSLFNLDMDLMPFYKAVKNDRVMARVVKKLYGLKSPTTPTVFEALIDSITEQQISLVAAHSMQRKLIRAFGEKLKLDGKSYFAFPTPEELARASLPSLRECGLSGRKSEYIKDISALVAAGTLDLEKFKAYKSSEDIIDELCKIRGIGVWTSEMTMIRGLRRMDAIPADDIGLQAHISHFYRKGQKITSTELRGIAESWGEWRGLAGYYLIVANQIGLE
jgi:DNA-3-methyladenine glycosylase II